MRPEMNCVNIKRESSRDPRPIDPEDAILSTLQAEDTELGIVELLDRLSEQGLDEAATKAAITRLLAESKIEMTPQRKLQIRTHARS